MFTSPFFCSSFFSIRARVFSQNQIFTSKKNLKCRHEKIIYNSKAWLIRRYNFRRVLLTFFISYHHFCDLFIIVLVVSLASLLSASLVGYWKGVRMFASPFLLKKDLVLPCFHVLTAQNILSSQKKILHEEKYLKCPLEKNCVHQPLFKKSIKSPGFSPPFPSLTVTSTTSLLLRQHHQHHQQQ